MEIRKTNTGRRLFVTALKLLLGLILLGSILIASASFLEPRYPTIATLFRFGTGLIILVPPCLFVIAVILSIRLQESIKVRTSLWCIYKYFFKWFGVLILSFTVMWIGLYLYKNTIHSMLGYFVLIVGILLPPIGISALAKLTKDFPFLNYPTSGIK